MFLHPGIRRVKLPPVRVPIQYILTPIQRFRAEPRGETLNFLGHL